ncbi:uncharacterized protein BDV14DRAFT_167508 [Aspergillus stella-maris]|uniref:uncharacterized protein n=1 Tax=Aspergillus stella-maris TaxID=1810926 RepID=UPI003CCD04EB
MSVWESYVDRLELPSYEALTLELYRGINTCLDEGDGERLMREMRHSRRGYWYW